VRAGRAPETAFTDAAEVVPAFDETLGEPRLRGIRVRTATEETEFGLDPFREVARDTIAELVKEGRLAAGDRVRWRALAFTREAAAQKTPGRLGRPVAPAIPIHPTRLETGVDLTPEGDDPVLIPESVLAEVGALTLSNTGHETGGILIGHLCRDPERSSLFAMVTAQVPARYTEACATRLTFTPATWTEVRSAIELRRREEIMLGWWHSHPVRAWCRECADDCRATCTLADGFLSAEDRRLHRVVFPRAFSIALVANDVSEAGPTYTLFGWRRGVLAPRALTRIGSESQ
jgi:hypothetical protein